MADIVGSTELAVRAGPEEYRETLAAYHLCVEQCVRAAGGEVAQFLGDGVLASFGQRQTGGNHAERAIRAALQLVRDVNRLEVGRQQIRARVGVATGLVVVSDVLRSADTVGHAIAGITPNMATRLQELADPEAVVISDSTKQLAGRFFVYRSLGSHRLKGFAEPIEAWQVEAEGAVESRFSALRRSSTTELIGRAAEMAQLTGMWRSAQIGKGQVLLLRGNAGIGKSHLIDAFCHTAGNGLRPHVLDLHASPHHANTALYAVTKLLQREARLVSSDSGDVQQRKLTQWLAESGVDPGGQVVSALADLLNITPNPVWPQLPSFGHERRLRILEAIQCVFASIARQRPLLLLVEDLQWLDATTVELIGVLAKWVAAAPVLLIITRRTDAAVDTGPDRGPDGASLLGLAHVVALDLPPLPNSEIRRLIEQGDVRHVLSPEAVQSIVQQSDGIPLFAEELTRNRLDAREGRPIETDGPVRSGRTPIDLPSTLRGTLSASLDRVGSARSVALEASVIGREFTAQHLALISSLDEKSLQAALDRLVDSSIIRRSWNGGGTVYLFRHALIQETAYDSMIKRDRRALHLTLARRLAAEQGSATAPPDELIARHYSAAEAYPEAIVARRRGAGQALARGAQMEAATLLHAAIADLRQLPNDRRRQETELELTLDCAGALASARSYGATAVARLLLTARRKARQLRNLDAVERAEFGMALHYLVKGDLKRSSAYALAVMASVSTERTVSPADALMANGMVLMQQGKLLQSRNMLEQCKILTKPETDDPDLSALGMNLGVFCRSYLAYNLALIGDIEDARRLMSDTLDVSRRLNENPAHARSHAMALSFAGRMHVLLRDSAAVEATAAEMVAIAEPRGYTTFKAYGVALFAWVDVDQASVSQLPDAIQKLGDSVCDVLRAEQNLGTIMFQLYRAEKLLVLGRKFEALAILEKAAKRGALGSRVFDAEIQRLLGDALCLGPESDDVAAARCYLCALDIARSQGSRVLEERTAGSVGRLNARADSSSEARTLLVSSKCLGCKSVTVHETSAEVHSLQSRVRS